MFRLVICFGLLFLGLLSRAGSINPLQTNLTEEERNEVRERLQYFYSENRDVAAMDQSLPKFSVTNEQWTEPNPKLKPALAAVDPLLTAAGKKLTPQFQKARCEHIFKKKYPYIECEKIGLWDETEGGELFARLLRTWITPEKVAKNLNDIPANGQVANQVWSGDYWRMRWGLTSYRYSDPREFSTYREAVDYYHQPGEWLSAVASLTPSELKAKLLTWSPAEKYDLLVGDENMSLTQQQKREGSDNLGEDGNVESWFGICHGWAPASFMVPSPNLAFSAVSARGTRVDWYPDDVRAMATLAWANGNFSSNFIGGRCNQKNPARYENGRLSQPECFDNNPMSFHLALGNMIGIQKTPIIMDAAFDYQVWNQPLLSYHFEYFNPLQIDQKGEDWQKFVVPYDTAFKAKDRFQTPLTRGHRLTQEKYDDSKVEAIVGVMATVVYLAESTATHSPTPSNNNTVRVTYTYDLELERENGKLVPSGGEWHNNRHPDFLWVPVKDSVARLNYDATVLNVDLNKSPEGLTTSTAVQASGSGYPLCQVMEQLVGKANGSNSYRCR